MQLLFLDQLDFAAFTSALGWTLVHSIWQGLVAAILAMAILVLIGKSRPLVRYNLLALVFVFFIAGVVFTFFAQQPDTPGAGPGDPGYSSTAVQSATERLYIPTLEQTKSYFMGLERFLDKYVAIIVAVWFIVFCWHCIRLCAGLAYIHRMRNYKVSSPSAEWTDRLARLKEQMGIRKHVKLMESSMAKVPLVIGFFKPLILLPVGLMANLPYHQVESILLHELSHIRRRDYLVNLLQHFAETIFFFNPGILWISALLKRERENCCDEAAMQYVSSKFSYIEALLAFQDYSLANSGFAMAFPGNKNYLLQRVKRIISNENKKLGSMQKTILFCCILVISGICILYLQDTKAQTTSMRHVSVPATGQLSRAAQPAVQLTDTVPAKKELRTRVTTDNANDGTRAVLVEKNDGKRELRAKLKNDKLVELHIDGKAIDSKYFEKYEAEVRAIIKGEKEKEEEEPAEEIEASPEINADIDTTEDSHKLANEILTILKNNNIIKETEGTDFKLDATELIVDNKKQPDELHTQLKQKYIHNQSDYFHFQASGGKMKITLHRVN